MTPATRPEPLARASDAGSRRAPIRRALSTWHHNWLPEGRALPESVWRSRHTLLERFALLQATGVGVFGLLIGASVLKSLVAVAVVAAPAILGLVPAMSRRLRGISVTVSLMFASAMIVDLANGATVAHFHFFVMIGLVAIYQDWAAFGVCVAITIAHHAVMGVVMPQQVFDGPQEWAHPIRWALIHGAFLAAAAVTHLILWRANEQQELRDPLTRLANRTAFFEALDRLLAGSSGPICVLFIDVDNFKDINDSGGHRMGDTALQHAADRVGEATRRADMVARIGGDEFAVLVAGPLEQALTVGNRIVDSLQAPMNIEGREVFVRASVGVADTELAGSREASDLLRDADLAMYVAKAAGRNQLQIYTAGVDTVVRERAALTSDIRRALERDELEVVYQPVVVGPDFRLCGMEALLRWNHPTRGQVQPADFIQVAEETGEIAAIGRWVLQTAVKQAAAWQQTLPGCADLDVAVNLASAQLRDPALLDDIAEALRAGNLAPSHLVLEVTEGTILSDLDLARSKLDAARDLGIRVAIDDFGTGYSSLSYLARLPADQVKIDRSFVLDLGRDGGGSLALVKGIIDIARALDLEVLAEGVENADQVAVLAGLHCTLAQGYFHSRPLTAAKFALFAAARAGVSSPTTVATST